MCIWPYSSNLYVTEMRRARAIARGDGTPWVRVSPDADCRKAPFLAGARGERSKGVGWLLPIEVAFDPMGFWVTREAPKD